MDPIAVTIECPECFEAELEVMLTPEEDMCRYYQDGSGYPGCPPNVEILEEDCDCRKDHNRMIDLAIEEAERYRMGYI